MRNTTFFSCLANFGLSTGASGLILGSYDFGSGSGISSGIPSLVYNLNYSTGSHFSGNIIYGPNLPLISVGSGNISGYNFTGNSSFRLGYNISGDFSILLDIGYDGCSRNTNNQSRVLISTTDSPTGSSGCLILGINDVNRLYLETPGYFRTLNNELHNNNLIYLSLANQNAIQFGYFDIYSQSSFIEEVTLTNNQRTINTIYIGGFLNNSNSTYTGYSGLIYNGILANKPIQTTGLQKICDCLFATGQTSGSGIVTGLVIPTVTGFIFSGIQESIITGYSSQTVTISKSDGTTISILFPSGLTGLVQTQELASILTGTTSISITGSPIITYLADVRKNNYLNFNIEFDSLLQSGDTLEIYTFPTFNSNVNLRIPDLEFPSSTNFTQLIGNGLVETNGIDYTVERGIISGFFEDDILSVDFPTGQSLISAFSGWWNRSKIQMSGGTFFPPNSQFVENIDTGRILITGISGQTFNPNYDFFINGQKLISGVHYLLIDASVSGWFGGTTGLTVGVFNPYLLPDFYAVPLYSPTGGLPTGIGEIEDSEITALPNFKDYTRYYQNITGTLQIFNGVTGYSEQIWVNGIRQTYNVDYLRNYNCTTANSGFQDFPDLPFKFFDSEINTGYYNL